MLALFAKWLAQSPLSHFLRSYQWIVPVSQSIHILAVAVLLGTMVVIGVRLAVHGVGEAWSLQRVARQIPLALGAFGVLLATGTLQSIIEPEREFLNPAFGVKMLLLPAAVIGTHRLLVMARNRPAPGNRIRLVAVGVALLWVTAAICGRWIAYLQPV